MFKNSTKFLQRMTDLQIQEFFNTHKYDTNDSLVVGYIIRSKDYFQVKFYDKYNDDINYAYNLYDDSCSVNYKFCNRKLWMQYLYSLFGEEYKQWYHDQLQTEFKFIFDKV
jgi:hypothetical protein